MKIKKDEHGLYVQIDGWICRPNSNERTVFKEGDNVRGSHLAGIFGYVRRGRKGNNDYICEVWGVKIVYWWHPSYDGKSFAMKMRQYDLDKGLLREKDYMEKF